MMGAQLLYNFTRIAKVNTCLISLEMTDKNMLGRLLSNMSGIPYNKVQKQALSDREKVKIEKCYKRFVREQKENDCGYDIYAPDEDTSVEELYMLLRPHNYQVIMLDYISLLKGVAVEDWSKLGDIARFCKIWSRTQNCLFVLLAQGSEDMKARYSGAIIEHSDNAWAWVQTRQTRDSGIIDITQPKARNMNDAPFAVKQDLSCFRMFDLDAHDMEEHKSKPKSDKKDDLDYLDDVGSDTKKRRK